MTGLVEFFDNLETPVEFTTHDGVLFLIFAFAREYGQESGGSSMVDSGALMDFLARSLGRPTDRGPKWDAAYNRLAQQTNNFANVDGLTAEPVSTVEAAATFASTTPPPPETVPEPAPTTSRRFFVHNNGQTQEMDETELQNWVNAGGLGCPVVLKGEADWRTAAHYGISPQKPEPSPRAPQRGKSDTSRGLF